MERLTVRRKDGRWAIANNDGASPMAQMEKFPSAINRLAAYEDTGLEPEEIKEVQEAMVPIPFGRFHDIMEAERAGRLVVLSCKVGDTVYAITSPVNIDGLECEKTDIDVFECVVESVTFYSDGSTQFRLYHHGLFVASFVTEYDFGKTVFLTREEAEAALKKRGEADNAKD